MEKKCNVIMKKKSVSKKNRMGLRDLCWPKQKKLIGNQRKGGCTPNGLKQTEKGKAQGKLVNIL